MTPRKPKIKSVKGYGVICNNKQPMSAYENMDSAKNHQQFLDKVYFGYCEHKIIPVLITPIKRKKK